MTEKQAHTILYTLWECGYLDKNFTEPHSEYDWAVDLLMNPPGVYCKIWNDYSEKKLIAYIRAKLKKYNLIYMRDVIYYIVMQN